MAKCLCRVLSTFRLHLSVLHIWDNHAITDASCHDNHWSPDDLKARMPIVMESAKLHRSVYMSMYLCMCTCVGRYVGVCRCGVLEGARVGSYE